MSAPASSTQEGLASVVDLLGYANRVAARKGSTQPQRCHAANLANQFAQVRGSQTRMYPSLPSGGRIA